MIETTEAPPEVTKVARDLTEILEQYQRLLTQAVRDGAHRLMPGGHAMVALADVASMESWENQQQATERYGDHPDPRLRRAYTSVEDEDPDEAWSTFQLLEFWSEQWRAELGWLNDQRPTIVTEANFLRWCLNWAWENEPAWSDFAGDVNLARLKLENINSAGKRVERTRVRCDSPLCLDIQADRGIEKPSHRNLIRLVDIHGREDVWKCPGCRKRFGADEFKRAEAAMFRDQGAERFIDGREAVAVLIGQGRGERTVRRWLAPTITHVADKCSVCKRKWTPQEYAACPAPVVTSSGVEPCGGDLVPIKRGDPEAVIEGYCEIKTRRTFLWWPDLWRLHNATRLTRRRPIA